MGVEVTQPVHDVGTDHGRTGIDHQDEQAGSTMVRPLMKGHELMPPQGANFASDANECDELLSHVDLWAQTSR